MNKQAAAQGLVLHGARGGAALVVEVTGDEPGFNPPVARPSPIPPDARIPRAQGSSGATATVPFAWRGHTKSRTTRARPSPDLAVWLE